MYKIPDEVRRRALDRILMPLGLPYAQWVSEAIDVGTKARAVIEARLLAGEGGT